MNKRAVIFLLFLLFSGCGQRANLIIKPLPIPPSPSEVNISQRGKNLIINLIYPEKFKNGDPLKKIDEIDILGTVFKKSVEFVDNGKIDYKLLCKKQNIIFDEDNKTFLKFEIPEKSSKTLFYIITKYKKFSDKSSLQNFTFINMQKPPILNIPKLTEDGIELLWVSKESFPFYAIYKDDFTKPYKFIEGTENSTMDVKIEYNKTIKYAVTGVLKKEPLTETELSNIVKIETKDTFPPPPVKNIKYLFLQNNKVIISWDKSIANDLKGYNIYYSFNGIVFKKYNKEPIEENKILIPVPWRRKNLVIYIRSVDNSGNESNKSEIIKIR